MKNQVIISIIAIIFASCGNDPIEKKESNSNTIPSIVTLTNAQYKNAAIETGSPTIKFISSTIKANGKVAVPPQSLVSISVPLGGFLKSTKLMPGMKLQKGALLATMEDQQYIQLQQDYLTAKAQLALDDAEYKRQKQLNENKAASDKVFEQAKANYQSRYILLKSLEEKLKLIGLNPQQVTADNISRSIPIVSPINGYVSAVNVNNGKYVNPSDILFELVNLDDIHIALTVFEKDVEKLRVGQRLTASTNNNPDKKYTCIIELISRNLSNENAVQVICKLETKTTDLLPGMFMNAQIDLSGNEVTALPEEAIVRYGNEQYVFVETDSRKYEMKKVQIGNTENGFTEIVTDLTQQKVVVKGAYTLLMVLKNVSEE